MATEALISWNAPEHFHVDKNPDWYWAVGIIALALTAVALILGQIIPAIFIIVAIVALIRILTPENTRWLSWVNIVLGVWLLISPFILGYMAGGDLWNAIILGILVIVFAAWSSTAARPSMLAR